MPQISTALFQSGKVILAGGCQNTEPIYSVYNLFNKVIGEIAHEIKKIDNGISKKNNKKIKEIFIDKSTISNPEIYNKVLGLIE